jgi:hypothetical protein
VFGLFRFGWDSFVGFWEPKYSDHAMSLSIADDVHPRLSLENPCFVLLNTVLSYILSLTYTFGNFRTGRELFFPLSYKDLDGLKSLLKRLSVSLTCRRQWESCTKVKMALSLLWFIIVLNES